MHAPDFVIQSNGDTAWDICFDGEVSEALSTLIIGIESHLEHQMAGGQWPEVIELIPAYRCLTVRYNPLQSPPEDQQPLNERLERLVGEIVDANDKVRAPTPPSRATTVEIPVCYEGDYAPDMNELCESVGLTRDEVIRRHSAPCYLVHMLGFTPGFLYLGGLDPRLACPRKTKPALNLAAGSVGIGGSQTGVYPQETPGGWQIIGRTPIQLFDPARDYPFIARPLDRIQFVPISAAEFKALEMAQEQRHGSAGKTPSC
ncbi:5-oxoprolinase subunit PxpB [Microbulbifer agarilyticus]|uniref:5-oxoprolinase subunit PxpB n=1 Tax=Microbulbifer agarilyticus TaxID=260552 RepID=UPI001C987117|nr:5-oxoprolinase subunit PxpB [Microbulbifer agarilyticus]MBY6191788.1 5-oxoprolinase subunit PxpB [Microbulbifer agarilyticus]MBY6212908.1 5-oxoprolinase subunit PxpB [Microbulbifer agarilyticus]